MLCTRRTGQDCVELDNLCQQHRSKVASTLQGKSDQVDPGMNGKTIITWCASDGTGELRGTVARLEESPGGARAAPRQHGGAVIVAPVGEVDRDSLCQPPTRSSPVPARDDAGPLPDVVALRSQPPRHGIRDRLNRWIPTFAGVTACDDRRWPRHPLTRGSPPARIIASMNERAGLCGQSNHPGPCPNTNLGRGGDCATKWSRRGASWGCSRRVCCRTRQRL